MFLISKNFAEIETELDFDAYLYGPHSEIADGELDELKKIYLVELKGNEISLTEEGKKIAEKIYNKDAGSRISICLTGCCPAVISISLLPV